ncbi:MAG: hypothetical protein AAF721_30140 [Myxococcota bacterium]
MSLVVALLVAVAPAPTVAVDIPSGPTAEAKLATDSMAHRELLRIDRDFGMAHWEIALDGWLPRDAAPKIEDIRLWWVNTDKANRRKPFSRHLSRVLEFSYAREGDASLRVRLAGDGKEYRFEVALDVTGVPAVFADVELADARVVARCRCESGRLLARRVIGIPIGIGSLSVRCRDAEGTVHDAVVPYRVIEAGEAY